MAAEDYIKGFLIGGLIGAALGILYAPKSGKETREEICRTTQDLLDKAKAQYEDKRRKVEELANREKELLAESKRRLKKAVDAGVEALRQEKAGPSET
ncbi:MAG TPA: YtxH domain-containing protein [Syntrophales bacterium]|nr:YtxH domain-containing protein [Syntrophales bacterium]